MKTKLTKSVTFLEPFLKGLQPIIPMHKVSHIRGYRVAKGLNERGQASIIRHSTKRYTINLKVEALVDGNKQHEYQTIEQILLDLAHELAHLKEWQHTPEHFKLQAKVMLHFAKLLKVNDIKDHSRRINSLRSKHAKTKRV